MKAIRKGSFQGREAFKEDVSGTEKRIGYAKAGAI